jgi:hypothetical protein
MRPKALRRSAFQRVAQVTGDAEANGGRFRSSVVVRLACRLLGPIFGGHIDLELANNVAVTMHVCGNSW